VHHQPHARKAHLIRSRAGTALLCSLLLGVGAAGCSSGGEPGAPGSSRQEGEPPADAAVVTRAPQEPVALAADDDPAALAVAASTALFERSSVVVLAGADDPAAQQAAAALATGAGVPVLLTGDPTAGEVDRLGTETVLAVGDPAAAWAESAGTGADVVAVGEGRPDELEDLPAPEPQGVDVLTTGDPTHLAATATARAAGAAVHEVPDGDPRASADAVTALGEGGGAVLALGSAFGPAERLQARVATAATGVQLPGGGQRLWPGRLLVALYGSPVSPSLGVLGEQPVDAAVERARAVAAEYDALPATEGVAVVPTMEIITTVASSSAGPDGDYSTETDVEVLRPWVEAAGAAGIYVVLDLQPGRTDFLTQAQRYEELLALPHVGLALDPEWRLEPGQVHLRQIGAVGVDEVNAVATWLADLTRERALPQKVLMVHQFRLSMIDGRERLDTSRDELAVVLHGDGNGEPGTKLATWRALTAQAPPGVHWGWKNFYDEDTPTFTPQQTLDVEPEPVFVSYQ
jgi:hypothetical protein